MLFTEAGRCSPSSVGRLASGSQASKQVSKASKQSKQAEQASKQASRQASRPAGKQASKQVGRQAGKQAGRQAGRQAGEASSFESRVGESVADDSSGRQVREDKIDKGKEVYPQGWSGKDIVDKRCEAKGRKGRRIRSRTLKKEEEEEEERQKTEEEDLEKEVLEEMMKKRLVLPTIAPKTIDSKKSSQVDRLNA
ncbi:LOW QUALITY PROTEIN: hypothetical protein V1478_010728 [Vespula squamosa]|uniref:Uncharacterized protein n=1 Tax=Vespula squamosa TaxID=30214 RepID=A0ABD2AIK2_VESSQ